MDKYKLIKKNGENRINNNNKDFSGHYVFNNKNNNDYNNLGCNLFLSNNNKNLYGGKTSKFLNNYASNMNNLGANKANNCDVNTNTVGPQNNMHFFYSLNNGTGVTKQRKISIEKSVIFDESQGEIVNRKNQSSNEETKRKFKYIRPRK